MLKLIAGCICAAAIALSSGLSLASASPVITHPTGTALEPGVNIRGTSVGLPETTVSGGGTGVQCTTASFTGPLVQNSGSGIAIEIQSLSISGYGTWESCVAPNYLMWITTSGFEGGTPWCMTTTEKEHEFEIRGGGCSEASRPIRLITHGLFATNSNCIYESKGLRGTFKTHPEDALVSFVHQEMKKVSGPLLCFSAPFLDISFTLETDAELGGPLYIS